MIFSFNSLLALIIEYITSYSNKIGTKKAYITNQRYARKKFDITYNTYLY